MKYNSLCYSFGGNSTHKSLEDALERLDQEINLGIDNGWIPQGGICIAINNSQGTAAQAMIKENA